MFTGIITGVGRIAAVHDLESSLSGGTGPGAARYGKRVSLEAPAGYLDDVGIGDSIALNGACMTVTALDAAHNAFTVDISAESLTALKSLLEIFENDRRTVETRYEIGKFTVILFNSK